MLQGLSHEVAKALRPRSRLARSCLSCCAACRDTCARVGMVICSSSTVAHAKRLPSRCTFRPSPIAPALPVDKTSIAK